MTPEEIEEEERDTKEFLKKNNEGLDCEGIIAALEEQEKRKNERRNNFFWY